MKLKKLTFGSGLIKTNLKRFWWTSALMTVYLFLMLPMSVINQIRYTMPTIAREYDPYMHIFENIMENNAVVYAIAFPLILGCLILSYLHRVNSVTAFHSLPYTRESLYASAFLSGTILILIPMIVNALLLLAIMPFGGAVASYSIFDILKICGHYTLFTLMELSICFLVGMFTGNFFAHGVFSVIVNYLPVIIYYLAVEVLKIFLRGFAGENDMVYDILENFPGLKAFDAFDMSWQVFIIYVVSFIALVLLGILFYKKRPLESAGDIISFNFFKPIFKYGFTACVMVGGYLVFQGDRKEIAGIFFALLFAFIGYAAAEMLLTKSLRFWKNIKGYIIYIAVSALLVGVIFIDPVGFTDFVPEKSEIKKAYLNFETNSASVFRDAVGLGEGSNHYYRGNDGAVFEDEKGIETVLNFHKEVIEIPEARYNDYVVIGYVLENGETVLRYFEANKYMLDEKVGKITKNEDYINAKHPILRREREEVSAVRVQLYSEDREIMITKKEDINLFLDAMIEDRVALGEVSDYGNHTGYIQLIKSGDKNLHYEFDLSENMPKSIEVLKGL